MKKKSFLILSGVVLAFGLLVGCGNGEQPELEQDVIQQPNHEEEVIQQEDVIQQPDIQVPATEDLPSSSSGETEEPTDEETVAPTDQPTDSEKEGPSEEPK